jgi:hypothetical protein
MIATYIAPEQGKTQIPTNTPKPKAAGIVPL